MCEEVSSRSLEIRIEYEEWREEVWDDCPGLECKGFFSRFRVWPVPQRTKEGFEPHRPGGNRNAGIKARWEGRTLSRRLGES